MLISNVSFPKFLEEKLINGGDCNLILPFLIKSINQLKKAGADFIVLPCNTLHSLLPIIRKSSNLEFVDLIEETSKEVERNYLKVGVLCTTKTRKEGLYDKNLKSTQLIYPNEEEQSKVSGIILKIISGNHSQEDKGYIEALIKKLIDRGAEKVILACTDLTNLIENNPNVIDTTKILLNVIAKKII